MKVLQINTVYQHSSTGRMTIELHEYMKRRNIVSTIAAVDVPSENREFIKFSSPFSSHVHALLSRLSGRQGYFSYFSTCSLIKKIRRLKPDVVQLGVLHSNCINLPLLLKFLGNNNIPTAITLHDCWYFTGHCCYFTDTNCNRWKTGCGYCPDLKNWNKSLFFDFSSKNLKDKQKLFEGIKRLGVIGVSDWVTSFVKDSILKNAKIVRRIYNWIDINQFRPTDNSNLRKKLGLVDDFVVLGCSQGWSKEKGLFDFVEMAKRSPNYKFVLVGALSKEYLPLPKNVISVGALSGVSDLAQYYSMADVFYNPSTRETFGKVTVEALACGTPVVAYNLTATPELIKKGCGYVVDYQDFDRVEKCFEEIERNGSESYLNKCREYASKEFSPEKLMGEYIQLYDELMND